MSAEHPGTLDQQRAVREALALTHGTYQWRVIKRLDASLNEIYQRSYSVIEFLPDDLWPPDLLAIAGVTGINFRASYNVGVVGRQVQHEVGHQIDKHLLTAADRFWFMLEANIDPSINTWNHNVQEVWADAFADWFRGTGWPSLTPILLPD